MLHELPDASRRDGNPALAVFHFSGNTYDHGSDSLSFPESTKSHRQWLIQASTFRLGAKHVSAVAKYAGETA
jgi:hypothetical protein